MREKAYHLYLRDEERRQIIAALMEGDDKMTEQSPETKQKIFFTSDLHFGHENVLRFDNRPFQTIEEMDEELIRRWNAKVGKGDLVYVLGDLI